MSFRHCSRPASSPCSLRSDAGLVNKQIAAELSIAPQTVKFHLTNVYRKLGVANRTEAIRYAFEHELVELEVAAV